MGMMVKLMGIKLRVLSVWIPKFLIKKELKRTTLLTNNYLDKLIIEHGGSPPKQKDLRGNINDLRKIMALSQNIRVKILIDIMGEPKAKKEVREKMFEAGFILGQHSRKVLGVSKNLNDTIKAAKILYKILGINFVTETNNCSIVLWVNSCTLSKYYTAQTCNIMSYVDKGVLNGLNEDMDMEFIEKITSGSKRCKACITIGGGNK